MFQPHEAVVAFNVKTLTESGIWDPREPGVVPSRLSLTLVLVVVSGVSQFLTCRQLAFQQGLLETVHTGDLQDGSYLYECALLCRKGTEPDLTQETLLAIKENVSGYKMIFAPDK